jgi:hypothetical protein
MARRGEGHGRRQLRFVRFGRMLPARVADCEQGVDSAHYGAQMMLPGQPNPIVVIGRRFLGKEFPVIPPPLYLEAAFSGASLHCLP